MSSEENICCISDYSIYYSSTSSALFVTWQTWQSDFVIFSATCQNDITYIVNAFQFSSHCSILDKLLHKILTEKSIIIHRSNLKQSFRKNKISYKKILLNTFPLPLHNGSPHSRYYNIHTLINSFKHVWKRFLAHHQTRPKCASLGNADNQQAVQRKISPRTIS